MENSKQNTTMIQLYLLRHGVAVPHGTPGVPEDQRPLTSEGEHKMHMVGAGLRQLEIQLDRIISSPLPRALRTAEIVAEELALSRLLETSDALRAERGAESIRDWLRSRTEPRLMLVGHNPSLSRLVDLLVTGDANGSICELRKGGLAALGPRPDGGMIVEWIARPRLFKKLLD